MLPSVAQTSPCKLCIVYGYQGTPISRCFLRDSARGAVKGGRQGLESDSFQCVGVSRFNSVILPTHKYPFPPVLTKVLLLSLKFMNKIILYILIYNIFTICTVLLMKCIQIYVMPLFYIIILASLAYIYN